MAGLQFRATSKPVERWMTFRSCAFACQPTPKPLCKSRPLSLLPHIAQRVFRFSGSGLLAFVLTLLASQPAQAASSVGPVRIIEAQGKVEVLRANSAVWD